MNTEIQMDAPSPGRLDCRRRYRRLVLDMHIPDWEPGLLAAFDPERIADLLVAGRINYATVYAQSSTGHCYWPTTVGKAHAATRQRDLFPWRQAVGAMPSRSSARGATSGTGRPRTMCADRSGASTRASAAAPVPVLQPGLRPHRRGQRPGMRRASRPTGGPQSLAEDIPVRRCHGCRDARPRRDADRRSNPLGKDVRQSSRRSCSPKEANEPC